MGHPFVVTLKSTATCPTGSLPSRCEGVAKAGHLGWGSGLDGAFGGGRGENRRLIEMGDRLHGTDLLQDAYLVRRSPALDDLCVRVELRDLHAADLDLLAGGGHAVEGAVLGAGDGVGEGDVILVGHHVLHGDFEVWKGRVELGEPLDEARRSRTLIVGGIMVFYAGVKHLRQPVKLMTVDDFTHLLLRADVGFFAHKYL